MEPIKPMLWTSLKNYSAKDLSSDIVSGIIVAVIALPLSIALALASGVGPEEGLYTAIIAGFLISAFGGSKVQIAGPTAAFATIVAGIVANSGLQGLMVATVMAGILLIVMGVLRLGKLIRFIPGTITIGFTAGIAVTILIGQLKDFFGLAYPAGTVTIETVEKVEAVAKNFGTLNPWALAIGALSLAILILWPKVSAKIPASLIAVLVGSLIVKFAHLPVNTIGDLYTVSSKLPTLHLHPVSFSLIRSMFPNAITIAILAAIESLLSCVVADGMTGDKHRPDTELIAQGIGNIGSALFGGIPATGAIARTAANINNGGKTPVAGMVHSVVLLLVLLLLMPFASYIPMPVIAAVLFVVAYNMCQWRPFVNLVKTAPKSDIIVLVITFILTVVFDLVVAIGVGLGLACLLFMKRMSEETDIRQWEDAPEDEESGLRHILPEVSIYEIEGPLFFGSVEKLSAITARKTTKALVLRMRSVTALDSTALSSLEKLYDRCKAQGAQIIFSHVNPQPMKVMEHSGFVEKVGREFFCNHIEEAIEMAEAIAGDQ
ncbi:MAG: sulfate permease [Firmicutes bacterium]|nr:sulfate permease [Bacillota bacterium]MBQ6295608.1 sulfate permease [Bacillota bacterium]